MLLAVPIAIALAGGLTWAAIEKSVERRSRAEQERQDAEAARIAAEQAEQARLDRIAEDPEDHLAYRLNGDGPNRRAVGDGVAEANRKLTEAKERLEEIARDFPGTSNPPRKWVILMLALSALWVGAFVAQFCLDWPLFHSITGNPVNAVPLTVVMVGILAAASLCLTLLWDRRTGEDAISARMLRGGTIGIATLFVAALAIVVLLAPKRAELDYADRIEQSQQQIAVFKEDGDTTAERFMEAKLTRLTVERDQAGHVYQGLALVAGLFEGGAGFAAPTGLQLLMFFAARRRVRESVQAASDSTSKRDQHGEQFVQAVSQEFHDAGVLQNRLRFGQGGQALADPPRGLPPAQPRIPPAGPAPVRPRPAPRPPATPPAPPTGDTAPPDDLSFDQS